MDEADKEFQRKLALYQIEVTFMIAAAGVLFVLGGIYASAGTSSNIPLLLDFGLVLVLVGTVITILAAYFGIRRVKRIK